MANFLQARVSFEKRKCTVEIHEKDLPFELAEYTEEYEILEFATEYCKQHKFARYGYDMDTEVTLRSWSILDEDSDDLMVNW